MEYRIHTFTTDRDDCDKKLSRILSEKVESLSHSKAKLVIQNGLVARNDQSLLDITATVSTGDRIRLDLRQGVSPRPRTARLLRGLKIIHEDASILVTNKSPGVLVHQTEEKERGALIELIHRYYRKKKRPPGYLKPVHRIDKDTSGLVIFPRSGYSHRHLAVQFKEHSVARVYSAIVHGQLRPKQGKFESNIVREADARRRRGSSGQPNVGKKAITHYHVLRYFSGYSLVNCRLETGVTHQIRIHLSEAGHPLLGETIYIPKEKRKKQRFPRHALHAASLGFIHPGTGKSVFFEAELPDDMWEFINIQLCP
ncbi:MAG: hypothetical protein B6244_11010 [Candidatus Cloacimonetes bacterium 4572_55]|nr:MAG: hypothetical protein B6244_11010 [Candidatus Cloacimonetes bacterium 4572_55]